MKVPLEIFENANSRGVSAKALVTGRLLALLNVFTACTLFMASGIVRSSSGGQSRKNKKYLQ